MSDRLNRRRFLGTAAGAAAAAAAHAATGATAHAQTGASQPGQKQAFRSNLVVNDDGYIFLGLNDDLGKADLRRYLQSYCRAGVGAVAYCVGDMSLPTFYPTQVGVHYSKFRDGADLEHCRIYQNADNFASEPGGYLRDVHILRDLGRKFSRASG